MSDLVKGITWGVVVCGLSAVAVSLIAPPPEVAIPPVAGIGAPSQEAVAAGKGAPGALPAADAAPEIVALAEPAAPSAAPKPPEVREQALPPPPATAPAPDPVAAAPAESAPAVTPAQDAEVPRASVDAPAVTLAEASPQVDATSPDAPPAASEETVETPEGLPERQAPEVATESPMGQAPAPIAAAPSEPVPVEAAPVVPARPALPTGSVPEAPVVAAATEEAVAPRPGFIRVQPRPAPLAEPPLAPVAGSVPPTVSSVPQPPGAALPEPPLTIGAAETTAEPAPRIIALPQIATPAAGKTAPPAVIEPEVVQPLPEPAPLVPAGTEAEPRILAAPPEPQADLAAETEADPAPKINRPAVISGMPGKRVGRLPTIAAPVLSGDQPAASAAEAPAAEDKPLTGRPIEDDALPFDAGDSRPRLAIVLIEGADATALQDLPSAPLAVAVDPSAPTAAEEMQKLRAAGREVVALGPLPDGARPEDAAVAVSGYLATLPQAVAMIENAPGGLQPSPQTAAQVVDELARGGRGLIAYPGGLNQSARLAADAGLPFGEIYRDLDSVGEDPVAIRRTLDQAAFRAGQTGRVIVIGHASPQTVAALARWLGSPRAGTVVVAPVSAVLLGR